MTSLASRFISVKVVAHEKRIRLLLTNGRGKGLMDRPFVPKGMGNAVRSDALYGHERHCCFCASINNGCFHSKPIDQDDGGEPVTLYAFASLCEIRTPKDANFNLSKAAQ
jgi:hypothetical protein